ncbi:MAG: hypothetical protein H0W69_07330, partial [Gemmatimonadaceae bacterium]|nr:hypothetical protein [Gemmatimonadaceae bacterium]
KLMAAAGNLEGADLMFRQRLYSAITPMEVTFAFERAQLAARRNAPDVGGTASNFVVQAWQSGDPEVQGVVSAAKKLAQRFGQLSRR